MKALSTGGEILFGSGAKKALMLFMALVIYGPNLANMLLGKSMENCNPSPLTPKSDIEPELKHDKKICSKNNSNNSREIKGATTDKPKRKEVLLCLKDQWNLFANTLNEHSSTLKGKNVSSQVQSEISTEIKAIADWLHTQIHGRKRTKIPETKKETNKVSTPTVPLKSNEKPDMGNSEDNSVSKSAVDKKSTTPNSPKVPKK